MRKPATPAASPANDAAPLPDALPATDDAAPPEPAPEPAPLPSKMVAILDANNVLIGSREVPGDADGIEHGDLKTNGTYKWDAERQAFLPLGFGFGKPKGGQPHTLEFLIVRITEAMGDFAPIEAKEFKAWYDANLRKREEEMNSAKGRR